jgi:hypothetical protein
MPENFDDYRDRKSSPDLDISTRLSNELEVMTRGVAGSFTKIGEGWEQAKEKPLEFGAKLGVAAAAGLAFGAFAETRVLGGVMRAVGIGAGVVAIGDVAAPVLKAGNAAWNARTQGELNLASNRLATGLGQAEFDLLATIPAAGMGGFMGSSLRRSLATTVTLGAEASMGAGAAKVRVEQPHARQSQARTPNYEQFRQSGTRTASREEPRVLVGEIVDGPRTKTRTASARRELDIIDAEFTVISNEVIVPGFNHMKVRGQFEPNRLLPSSKDALTVVQRTDVDAYSVIARNQSHQAGLQTALSRLQQVEPGWNLRGGALNSPLHTRIAADQLTLLVRESMPAHLGLSPEAKAKLIQSTYGRADVPTAGRIVDIKV